MQKMISVLKACLCLTLCLVVACNSTRPEDIARLNVIVEGAEIDANTGERRRVYHLQAEYAEARIVDGEAKDPFHFDEAADIDAQFDYYTVSGDGRLIVSIYEANIQNDRVDQVRADLWIYSAMGKTRLTNSNKHVNRYPAFSNQGRLIYFVSRRGLSNIGKPSEQNSHILRTISRSGGETKRLGPAAFRYSEIQQSFDDYQLLVTSQEFADSPVYFSTMPINGGPLSRLQQGSQAQWLSNRVIVYVRRDADTGLRTIWTINRDGSQPRQIISDPVLESIQPSVDFTGRYIAFTRTAADFSVPGSAAVRLSDVTAGDLHAGTLAGRKKPAKDRNSLEHRYASRVGVGSGLNCESMGQCREVFIFDTKTKLTHQLTSNRSRDDQPHWSVDGRYLYIRSTRGGRWGIWRLNAKQALAGL